MAQSLTDYPIYDPPHRQGPNFVREPDSPASRQQSREFVERGRENFAYSLDNRAARLAALRSFLAKFSVDATLDESGLTAVSTWCPGNCGTLAADLRSISIRQAYFQRVTPRTDAQRGLNVIFDLGIFFGECLIARNSRLHWAYHPGSSDDGSANHSGYCIEGFKNRRQHLDPPGRLLIECGTDELSIRRGEVGKYVRTDTLVGAVRDYSTR